MRFQKKNYYDITKKLSNNGIFKTLSNHMSAFFGELFWISERIHKKTKMTVTNHKKTKTFESSIIYIILIESWEKYAMVHMFSCFLGIGITNQY